ncbi:MAG: nucleotidyltransferase substrate binding protein [Verrucomicrobiota bacterium]
MSQEIRWKQRFENFEKARSKFHKVLASFKKEPKNEIYQIALVQAFKFTYELAWKTLKDYLRYGGIEANLPREVIKESFSKNIIQDGQTWIDMLEDRNLLAHIYDEAKALIAIEHIHQRYAQAIDQVFQYLKTKSKS